jgi:hypothetical protein
MTAKATAMKKSVPPSDKKRKKQVRNAFPLRSTKNGYLLPALADTFR